MATPIFIWGMMPPPDMERPRQQGKRPSGSGASGSKKTQQHHHPQPPSTAASTSTTGSGVTGEKNPSSTSVATNATVSSASSMAAAAASIGAATFRTKSASTASVLTAASSTIPSAPPKTSSRLVTQRNGRTYLADPALPYPLPVDLPEIHRQALRTLLLIQLHGGPIVCPDVVARPPKRVLDIGCGSGLWSVMCHRFFRARGHPDVSFTGVDIAPAVTSKPDKDMDWTFTQHDLHHIPWPFPDSEFDFIFFKDNSLALTLPTHPVIIAEAERVLKPGGYLEIWETDHAVRMLRPHVPSASVTGSDAAEQEAASQLGAYIINANTPLSAPLNPFLVEYNHWVGKALESRDLMLNPCAILHHYMIQEIDVLSDIHSRRVAVPLSEVRWEREGVGGVVTRDGKTYVDMKGTGGARAPHQKVEKKTLTQAQAALRRTALLTLVQEIQAQELILREVNGKSQDEWDVWLEKMATDLMTDGGTSWGECLEAGVWWARKRT